MPKKYLLFAITLISLFAASRYLVPQPVEFDSLDECKRCLESRGFHCHIRNAKTSPSLVVSAKPMLEEDANLVSVFTDASSKHTVLVQRKSSMHSVSQFGNLRYWGSLYAIGDPTILDLIESNSWLRYP